MPKCNLVEMIFLLQEKWERQSSNLYEALIIKTVLKKKNKVCQLKLSDFKSYYKATVIKIVWYWHMDRYLDQQNRVENPEINLNIYGQLKFNKGQKTT